MIWISIAAIAGVASALMLAMKFSKPDEMTGEEFAAQIIRFVEGRSKHAYEWDDFISIHLADPFLDDLREQCSSTHDRFPPSENRGWCNEEGVAALRELARIALSHDDKQGRIT